MRAGRAPIVILGLVVATAWLAQPGSAAQSAQPTTTNPTTTNPTTSGSMPTIVTYELSKAQSDARRATRNPKSFWISEIVTRIEDKKPVVPHAIKKPATVEVGFIVDRSGRLVSKQVERSSGDAAVDKEALAVLDRAAPFPPMPAGVTDDHLAFTVPLRFK